MSDRRRINGPGSGVQSVNFVNRNKTLVKPIRMRKPNELRKMFLQTGLVPHATGSAYLELEASTSHRSFIPLTSTVKLSCTIQGPKPLQRNAAFSPNLQLNTSVKFAPFSTRQKRGYLRDNTERDLGGHLESALAGVIILDRWPKCSLDIAVTVLEGEEDCLWNEEHGQEKGINSVGLMNMLSGSIIVAMAALTDARIDCLDMLTAGVAAKVDGSKGALLDPCPSEHEELDSACVVAYLPGRDEIVEIWSKTSGEQADISVLDSLTDAAIRAAKGANKVLSEVLMENLQEQIQEAKELPS